MSIQEKEYLTNLSYNTFINEYPFIESNDSKKLNYWAERLKQAEELILNENRFFLLLDHAKFHPVYLTQNFYKILGVDSDFHEHKKMSFDFKRFHWRQLGAMLNFLRWGANFAKDYRYKVPVYKHSRYFCGLKLKHENGTYRTMFVKLKFLSVNKQGDPLLSLCEVEDISHLFKSSYLYWMRLSAKNDHYCFTRFHVSKGTKKRYDDILSTRELEVLKLCAERKSNKEIGKLLGISFQTVLKHRKNMIARTGVKDLTGLLHICNLCDLL